jgi:hypothetical protein
MDFYCEFFMGARDLSASGIVDEIAKKGEGTEQMFKRSLPTLTHVHIIYIIHMHMVHGTWCMVRGMILQCRAHVL